MGLDMYLNAKRYLWSWNDESEDKTIAKGIQTVANIPDDFEVQEIKIKAGYWRKANQIHKWFVENVQSGTDDCGYYDVSRQDLIDLKEICNKVIANKELAPTTLPTESGFFFGATEYDDWYYNDLSETVEMLDKALNLGKEWDFEYHSSW
mgnify:CR=1 FL=1|jgi:hypothetical protein